MGGVAVVTDSTADIPEDLAEKLNIHVVANTMVIAGKSLLDGIDISREEFYRRLPEMKAPPTTATAAPGVYTELYDWIFQQGASHIFSIHPSSKLSGIMNAATTAAQAHPDRVTVWDTNTISMGSGFQVLEAGEMAAGGAKADEIRSRLESIRPRIRVIAMLDTLEYVRRSGRVSFAKAHIGNFLRIKPFIEIKDGQVQSLGEVRTRNKGVERLKEMLGKLGKIDRLAILHTGAENEGSHFLDTLTELTHTQPLIVNVTSVIGAHAGPNALGFAAIVQSGSS
jgi:DegV family protein with EDD domain